MQLWSVLSSMLRPIAAPAPVPKLGDLNAYVLRRIASYPRSYDYFWPRGDETKMGTTHDISYKGEVYAKADPRGAFCSGITLEIFMDSYAQWCAAHGRPFEIAGVPDLAALDAFRLLWWGKQRRDTMAHALTTYGLGTIIERRNDAQPGDFVQLWRHNGSGHSAVFIDWVRGTNGAIVGMKYWSVQGGGSGYNTEYFGRSGNYMDKDQLTIVRVGV